MADALHALQQQWANHLRSPQQPAPAGVDPQRLALYRMLCVNGLDGLLAGSFGRLQAALGPQQWRVAVETFQAEYRCHTPLFPQVGAHFLAWLGDTALPLPAWAGELAHLEWTRHTLLFADASAPPATTAALDPQAELALSPLARVCGYRWPVHRPDQLHPDASEAAAPPTLLLLYRSADHRQHSSGLGVLAYRLLQAIDTAPGRLSDHLQLLASEAGGNAPALLPQVLVQLQPLHAAGVIHPLFAAATPRRRSRLPLPELHR